MSDLSGSIAKRYDALSAKDCCLSCGGAFSLAEIKAGDVCIDLGCGKGHDVLRMATLAGDNGMAWGVDISDGMLDTANRHAQVMGFENVRFIKSELEQIDLASDFADVVISNCTINHSLEQDMVWREIFRILKPGGHFVVSDIYATEKVPDIFRNDSEMVAQCWAGAVTKSQYMQHIEDAGFSQSEVLEESNPYDKGSIQVASFTIKGTKPKT